MAFPLVLTDYLISGRLVQVYVPDKNQVATSYRNGEIDFPYWSQVWPAAMALARFLVAHPVYTAGKRVLELAAGLGLPSVVAAHNAAFMVASDHAPDAVTAMQQTAAYHRLTNLQVCLLDWTTLSDNLSAEVLLLSDVSYDATLFALQEKVIRQFLAAGTTVIISTPQRLVAKAAIEPLLPFATHQESVTVNHSNQEVAVSLLVLNSRPSVSKIHHGGPPAD